MLDDGIEGWMMWLVVEGGRREGKVKEMGNYKFSDFVSLSFSPCAVSGGGTHFSFAPDDQQQQNNKNNNKA